jgi:hypothetical protein
MTTLELHHTRRSLRSAPLPLGWRLLALAAVSAGLWSLVILAVAGLLA